MRGLLNGEPSIQLNDGDLITATSVVQRSIGGDSVEIRRSGTTGWESQIHDLGPDPTADVRSDERSFAGVAWPSAGLLAVAGYEACVLVDLADGNQVARYELEFTDLWSLDVLDLRLADNGRSLIVLSTRRIWVLRLDAEPFSYSSIPPVRSAEPAGSELIVEILDIDDPSLGVSSVTVALPKPEKPLSDGAA